MLFQPEWEKIYFRRSSQKAHTAPPAHQHREERRAERRAADERGERREERGRKKRSSIF